MELEEEEEESPVKQQHDNYINFDIAQIVVKESRKDELDIKSPGMVTVVIVVCYCCLLLLFVIVVCYC